MLLGNTMHGDQVLHVDLVLEDVLSCTVLGVVAAGLEVVPDHGRLMLGGLLEGSGKPSGRQGDRGGGQKEGSEHDGSRIQQTGVLLTEARRPGMRARMMPLPTSLLLSESSTSRGVFCASSTLWIPRASPYYMALDCGEPGRRGRLGSVWGCPGQKKGLIVRWIHRYNGPPILACPVSGTDQIMACM